MKVLFLDRDGIINKERGDYTWRREDFEFTKNLFPFLRSCQEDGFKIIVITNQGGINKGLYSHNDVEELHAWMRENLEQNGIELEDVFYCPHHNHFQKCICRKPESQLIEKAKHLYGVDVDKSVMLGDRQRDVDAAEKAGIRGILIDSNPDWAELNLEL